LLVAARPFEQPVQNRPDDRRPGVTVAPVPGLALHNHYLVHGRLRRNGRGVGVGIHHRRLRLIADLVNYDWGRRDRDLRVSGLNHRRSPGCPRAGKTVLSAAGQKHGRDSQTDDSIHMSSGDFPHRSP
jgi:hypothetical protein